MIRARAVAVVVGILAVTGCGAVSPAPTGSASPPPAAEEEVPRACPTGLLEAVTEAISSTAIGPHLPTDVEVVALDDYRFEPPELNAETVGGCVLRAEYDWGDTHAISVVGVTSGSSIGRVEAALSEAGWDTPHTDYVWLSPDEQRDVMIWRVGDAAEAAEAFLSFAGWRDYVAEDEVLLVQAPTG